jgi:hypothetical protein
MTDVVIVEAVRTPMGRGNQRNGTPSCSARTCSVR